MIVTTTVSDLRAALRWAAYGLPSGHPVTPIVGGVLLAADENHIDVSAFDYDKGAAASCPATVTDSGTVLVSGQLLIRILDNQDPGRVLEISHDGGQVHLATGTTWHADISPMPLGEYPELPAMPDAVGTIEGDQLADMIARVVGAADRDGKDATPALTGVRIEASREALLMVTTDRYRMARFDRPWQMECTDEVPSVLFPAAALAAVGKNIPSGSKVTYYVSMDPDSGVAGLAGFGCDAWTLTTRLLGQEFPRYAQLIPARCELGAQMDTDKLLGALKRAKALSPAAAVTLAFDAEEVTLTVTEDGLTSGAETFPAAWNGEPTEIRVNQDFLREAAAAVDKDRLRIGYQSPSKPLKLTAVSDDEPTDCYILMPVGTKR